MLRFVPQDAKRILEVGCGEGVFGKQLLNLGNREVWGVELDPVAADKAAEVLTKVINGAYGEGLGLPTNYFDCVVFNDVLEHLLDPWATLAYTRSLLVRPYSGFVVASLPNFIFWHNILEVVIRRDWTYKEEGILDRTHLRFFTPKSMKKLFEDTGFEVVHLEGIRPSMDKRFRVINFFLHKWTQEMRFVQYAVIAKPAMNV